MPREKEPTDMKQTITDTFDTASDAYAKLALPPDLAQDWTAAWQTALSNVALSDEAAGNPAWEKLDALVADLALSAPEADPPPQLRDRLLARIATMEQEPPASAALQQPTETPSANFMQTCAAASAAPLGAATQTSRLQEGDWTALAPGVLCKILHQDFQTGLVTSLIKLEPGGYLPRHRHLGLEQTLVVEGDCRVNGETFYAGDFRLRPPDTEDGEVTTECGTTILLIAPASFENLDPHWPC